MAMLLALALVLVLAFLLYNNTKLDEKSGVTITLDKNMGIVCAACAVAIAVMAIV